MRLAPAQKPKFFSSADYGEGNPVPPYALFLLTEQNVPPFGENSEGELVVNASTFSAAIFGKGTFCDRSLPSNQLVSSEHARKVTFRPGGR